MNRWHTFLWGLLHRWRTWHTFPVNLMNNFSGALKAQQFLANLWNFSTDKKARFCNSLMSEARVWLNSRKENWANLLTFYRFLWTFPVDFFFRTYFSGFDEQLFRLNWTLFRLKEHFPSLMSLMNVSDELDEQDDEHEFLVWWTWWSDGEHDEQFGWTWNSDDEHESFLMVERESFFLMLRTIAFLSLDSPNYLSCRNIRIRTKIHKISPVNSSFSIEQQWKNARVCKSILEEKEEHRTVQISPREKRRKLVSANL